jgi:hypothetical protein
MRSPWFIMAGLALVAVALAAGLRPALLAQPGAALAQTPLHGYDRLQQLFNKGPAPPPAPYISAVFVAPPKPSINDEVPPGTMLARLDAEMSDGSPFGGHFGFGPPYYDADGCVAISGNFLILACGLDASIDLMQATIVAVPQRPFTR